MAKHEYNFRAVTPQGVIGFKLHSPWIGSMERLRRAEEVCAATANDIDKLSLLLEIFAPDIYHFDVFKIKEVEEPLNGHE